MDERNRIGEFDSESAERMQRRCELDELRRIMAELPVESPDDGFSGTDHDVLLYGEK